MGNFLWKTPMAILFLNLRVFLAELFSGLVFLIQEFQVVACQKIIEDVCTDKVGAWQANLVKDLGRGTLQNLVSQQQTGRFASNFAGANATLQDHIKISGRKP